jgi:beta-lactamase regulating signal transducer with metallopeptidase domain
MTLLLLLSGLGLLGLPAFARALGRRLPPAEWAMACAGLLAAGAIVIQASLAIQAAPTVLRTVGLEGIADLCEHVAPGGAPVGIAAATAAGVIALLAGRSVLAVRRVHRLARVERELGWHRTLVGHHLVVLPSQKPVAFSTAGRPGQVVMSRGLIAALSGDELAAVFRHEVAHVRHRHQRYLLLARAIEGSLGLIPMVRRGVTALRCAVERWADEEAAGPRPTDRASVHAALLRVAELASMPDDVAAFTTPDTVAERLEALRAAPTAGLALLRRTIVYLPAGLLLLATAVALDRILDHVAFLHLLAGLCPPDH